MDRIVVARKSFLGEYYIYARVSSIDQNVKQQSKYLREWAKKSDKAVVGAVLDRESGRIPLTQRKAFRKLLSKAVKDDCGIIVLSLDRLTRNWDDVTYIEKHFRDNWNRSPLLVTNFAVDLSNAMGRFLFRVFMAQACFMPEDMREKQKIGIARAKKENKYVYGRGRPKKVTFTAKFPPKRK